MADIGARTNGGPSATSMTVLDGLEISAFVVGCRAVSLWPGRVAEWAFVSGGHGRP